VFLDFVFDFIVGLRSAQETAQLRKRTHPRLSMGAHD
jgi:hypothetical protein